MTGATLVFVKVLLVLLAVIVLYVGIGYLYATKVVGPWLESLDEDEELAFLKDMRLGAPLEDERDVASAKASFIVYSGVQWPMYLWTIRKWKTARDE